MDRPEVKVAVAVDFRRQLVDAAASLKVPEGAIVVSEELLPSTTARLEFSRARGFVTERGGRFSHGSILARSMGVPAVTGVAGAPEQIRSGDRVVLDGFTGVVFVNPEPSVEREYERLESEIRAYREELRHLVDLPSETLDGARIGMNSWKARHPRAARVSMLLST